jgi:hypothetical protein
VNIQFIFFISIYFIVFPFIVYNWFSFYILHCIFFSSFLFISFFRFHFFYGRQVMLSTSASGGVTEADLVGTLKDTTLAKYDLRGRSKAAVKDVLFKLAAHLARTMRSLPELAKQFDTEGLGQVTPAHTECRVAEGILPSPASKNALPRFAEHTFSRT